MIHDDLVLHVEAALLAAGRPVPIDEFITMFEGREDAPDRNAVREAVAALEERWAGRAIEVSEVASGFRAQIRREYSQSIAALWQERPPRYSRALLETLALIAYRQPISRGEIEEVRGVSVSGSIMKTLLEREWVRVVGHREAPGRPALFGTTRHFLDTFSLKSLEALPPLAELRDLDEPPPDLFAGLQEVAGPGEEAEPAAGGAGSEGGEGEGNQGGAGGEGSEGEGNQSGAGGEGSEGEGDQGGAGSEGSEDEGDQGGTDEVGGGVHAHAADPVPAARGAPQPVEPPGSPAGAATPELVGAEATTVRVEPPESPAGAATPELVGAEATTVRVEPPESPAGAAAGSASSGRVEASLANDGSAAPAPGAVADRGEPAD